MSPHREIEHQLAQYFQAPAALLFNSGYHANVGLISALARPGDAIFSDAYNHASLIDGCRLSRAQVSVYRHLDPGHLAQLLERCPAPRKLVVSDSVFSMDGDTADVLVLSSLCERHGATLILDEAHAIGVVGPQGRGVAASHGLGVGRRGNVIISGTLGKSLGSFGGFVLGSRLVIDWLLNRSRPFIFSTALPPAVVTTAAAALEVTGGPEGDTLRVQLRRNVERLAAGLLARGLRAEPAPRSCIFPLVIGDAARTMEVSDALIERGVFVQGIRPPTVAPGSSRLRIAVIATHLPQHIDQLLEAIDAVRHRFPS
jgi:8-amino-7-oxononanoate synthase